MGKCVSASREAEKEEKKKLSNVVSNVSTSSATSSASSSASSVTSPDSCQNGQIINKSDTCNSNNDTCSMTGKSLLLNFEMKQETNETNETNETQIGSKITIKENKRNETSESGLATTNDKIENKNCNNSDNNNNRDSDDFDESIHRREMKSDHLLLQRLKHAASLKRNNVSYIDAIDDNSITDNNKHNNNININNNMNINDLNCINDEIVLPSDMDADDF